MTLKEAKKELKPLGITLTKNIDEEYRVNQQGGREETAYYTDSLLDALETGHAMYKEIAGN